MCPTSRFTLSSAFIGLTVVSLIAASARADEASVPSGTEGNAGYVVDPLDIPPERDPLAHAFHRPSQRGGFYLRASTSIGVHNTHLGPSPWLDEGVEAHGFGSGFGLDVGGLVAPFLALHANTTVGVLWDGNVHKQAAISGAPLEQARVVAFGFAPGATLFIPHDFRFTGAFGVGLARVQRRQDSDTTDPGFYMNLVAGKDFVLSPNFSLGLDFQIVYMLLGNDTRHEDARVRQFLFGLSGAFDSI